MSGLPRVFARTHKRYTGIGKRGEPGREMGRKGKERVDLVAVRKAWEGKRRVRHTGKGNKG